MACGKMRAGHNRLAGAVNDRCGDHHDELARMLLEQTGALSAHIHKITGRAGELVQAIPGAWGVDADGVTGPGAGLGPDAAVLPAVACLDEITGIGGPAAQVIIAEVGLNMSVFPHSGAPGVLGEAISPDSPGPGTSPGGPATATLTSRASWARPPPRPPAPTPSSASAAGGSSSAAASSGPWSPRPLHPGHRLAPARRPPQPASASWAPATTPATSIPTAIPAATSASWRHWATPPPTPTPPDPDQPDLLPVTSRASLPRHG